MHPVTVLRASKKIVNVDFYFLFSQMIVLTFTRTEETKIRTKLFFYSLDGPTNKVYLLMVLPKRPMGCQFINAHSHLISAVFNFNTNISIGDVSHVYYTTLYTIKTTQEEVAKKQLRIGHGVIVS